METKTNQTEKRVNNSLGIKTIDEVDECHEPKNKLLAIIKIQNGKAVKIKQKTNKSHYEGNPVKDYSNQKDFKEDNCDKYPEELKDMELTFGDTYNNHLRGR